MKSADVEKKNRQNSQAGGTAENEVPLGSNNLFSSQGISEQRKTRPDIRLPKSRVGGQEQQVIRASGLEQ